MLIEVNLDAESDKIFDIVTINSQRRQQYRLKVKACIQTSSALVLWLIESSFLDLPNLE